MWQYPETRQATPRAVSTPPTETSASSAMPVFRCLGNFYQLSQADLDRAPNSILSTAWNASDRDAPVSLESWPEPDLDVLEVERQATLLTMQA